MYPGPLASYEFEVLATRPLSLRSPPTPKVIWSTISWRSQADWRAQISPESKHHPASSALGNERLFSSVPSSPGSVPGRAFKSDPDRNRLIASRLCTPSDGRHFAEACLFFEAGQRHFCRGYLKIRGA